MLAAEMSTDSSYILTWATVIYNDLIMPCFRRPLSEKARLLTIRTLIVLIGIFLVFYGLVYELPGTAFDYIAITGTICVASMFALLMGAIYMPWINRVGAYAAIILGAVGPLSFLVVNAMADASHQIAPATAGLSAYALAFGGLIFGSLLGNCFLQKNTVAEELTEATGGQRLMDNVLLWFWTGTLCRHRPLVGDHVVSRRLDRPRRDCCAMFRSLNRTARRRNVRRVEPFYSKPCAWIA